MPELLNILKLIKGGENHFEANHDPDGLKEFASYEKVIKEAKDMGLITYTGEIRTLDSRYVTAIHGVAITLAGKSYLRINA